MKVNKTMLPNLECSGNIMIKMHQSAQEGEQDVSELSLEIHITMHYIM